MNARNFSRELRRARARIRYLEAENALLSAKLKARDLAPAPGALGVYRGAPPVGDAPTSATPLPQPTNTITL